MRLENLVAPCPRAGSLAAPSMLLWLAISAAGSRWVSSIRAPRLAIERAVRWRCRLIPGNRCAPLVGAGAVGGRRASSLSPKSIAARSRMASSAGLTIVAAADNLDAVTLADFQQRKTGEAAGGTGPRPPVRFETSTSKQIGWQSVLMQRPDEHEAREGFDVQHEFRSLVRRSCQGLRHRGRKSAAIRSNCCCFGARPSSASCATSSSVPPAWARTAAAMAPSTSGAGQRRMGFRRSNNSSAVSALRTALPRSIRTSTPSGQFSFAGPRRCERRRCPTRRGFRQHRGDSDRKAGSRHLGHQLPYGFR